MSSERGQHNDMGRVKASFRAVQDKIDAMDPDERKALEREWAIDWMYGETRIGLNDTFPTEHLSREECARIYDEVHGG